jgi:hypothetical protein
MNRVTFGSGDGLYLSIETLLGNMGGFHYRDSEGKSLFQEMGLSLRRGPVGKTGERVHLQGTMRDSQGLQKWSISVCRALLRNPGGIFAGYLE